MFIPNPLQIKAMIVAAALAAIAILALLVWGLYWRGEYRECKVENTALTGQVAVLADKLDTQSKAIQDNAATGQAALAVGRQLLAEARKKNPAPGAAKSDAAASGPAQPGKGCPDAWTEIESGRAR